MSDNKPDQGQHGADLAAELRALGQQIEQTVRAALETDRAKTVRNDLVTGLNEVGKQVQVAIKSLQANPKVHDLAERGQQALTQAQDSQAWKDFQETLVGGISQLNDRLAAFVARLETTKSTNSTPPTQQVPVDDQSNPATGETTRL